MTDLNEFTVLRDHGPAASPSEAAVAGARAALMAELRAASSPAKAGPKVRVNLNIAAVVAAVLVIGIVFAVVGRFGATEPGQAGGDGVPGPIRLVDFRVPDLPPELSPVPAGLRVVGLSSETGWIGRGYGAAGTDDAVDVRTSWRGHNPQRIDAEFRETSFDGKKAFVSELEAIDGADTSIVHRTVHLAWQSAPETWTILAGSGRFAAEEALRALAVTLVPATDKLDLSIDVAPQGWELAAFKDGVTTIRDPGAPDRELTVSLLAGPAEDVAKGTMVPVVRSTPVKINGGRGELLKLTDGSWMLPAPLPDGRAFLLQASSAFSEQQVIEVAEGVRA